MCRIGGMHMNIGFIGAGKAGFSLGKYLTERGMHVTGYYSRSPQSSLEAAKFTDTGQYLDLKRLAEDSDAIFLTVPDGAIRSVWEQLKELPIQNKRIIHCSGSLSSAVFYDIGRVHAYGYSIHPMLAINDRYTSYEKLSGAFFTIEGSDAYLDELRQMFLSFGNRVEVIPQAEKTRYHAAAVFASNLYEGLVNISERMLCECGFSSEHAQEALAPLILENAKNIVEYGTEKALTGPVERGDAETVAAHLAQLSGDEKEIYRLLSKEIAKIARQKHPTQDFTALEGELER